MRDWKKERGYSYILIENAYRNNVHSVNIITLKKTKRQIHRLFSPKNPND